MKLLLHKTVVGFLRSLMQSQSLIHYSYPTKTEKYVVSFSIMRGK